MTLVLDTLLIDLLSTFSRKRYFTFFIRNCEFSLTLYSKMLRTVQFRFFFVKLVNSDLSYQLVNKIIKKSN